jgi:hypothetical protein
MDILNKNIKNVRVDIINYYIFEDNNKISIKNIKNHELFYIIELIKEKNIDILSYDFVSHIYENKKEFLNVVNVPKTNIYENFLNGISNIKDIKNLEEYVNKFKKIYSSILNDGLFENKADPITLLRIRKGYENILVIDSGKIRFFIAKILNMEKISAVILDETENNIYNFI